MKTFVLIPRKYVDFVDEELALVKTIYGSIVDYIIVKNTNSKTYLSKDKIEKIKSRDFDKLVVMDKLKPSQFINLARELKRDIADRIMVILEIFANHAGSREALLQIELARLRYTLPLIKEAIRYAKLGELHGFLGAGRYGYEKYYTMLKKREARVRRELEKLRLIRGIRRKARVEAGLPHVVIVGYTCAGKTSLFNTLTGLSKPVGPEPFTTLSPKSYRVNYRDVDFIVTDTVGFIRDIPPEVIESFYATLEEVSEADIVVDVVDASKKLSEVISEIETGKEILRRIGAYNKPVVYALNKIDKLQSLNNVLDEVGKYLREHDDIVPISCAKKLNIDLLLDKIREKLVVKGYKSNEEKNIRA
ncbi:MAG: GTPase HflX [Desulfurococcaceae archaeon]